jgi:integrase
MPHHPWYRKHDDWWYCQVGRKQIKLVKGKSNKKEARRQFDLLDENQFRKTPSHLDRLTVIQICRAFMKFSRRNHDPDTTDWFRRFLKQFCRRFGKKMVHAIDPEKVAAWIDEVKTVPTGRKKNGELTGYRKIRWSSSTKNSAVSCVKRAFNWAVGKGYLTVNPLRSLEKPPMERRERILSPEERRAILGAADGKEFKMYLFAIGSTGCRPGEVRKVTAAEVDLQMGTWRFKKHKTGKRTGRPRIVYLTPAMVNLCRRLMRERPDGPIFRNSRGLPWSRNAVRIRLRRIRLKLGLDAGVCAYAYRHTWVTEALAYGGLDVHTVAELAGHKGTKMIETHYSHLSKMVQHLRDAAIKATRPRPKRTG